MLSLVVVMYLIPWLVGLVSLSALSAVPQFGLLSKVPTSPLVLHLLTLSWDFSVKNTYSRYD